MNNEQKRAFVGEMSSRPSWKKKVRDMTDDQVFAIFMREMRKQGTSKPKAPKESDDDPPPF